MAGSKGDGILESRRVLVIEDEYFIADDLARALQGQGAEVIGPVPDRDNAMTLISSGGPVDLAVIDVNLRGEASYPLADALAERGIPFMFATGYQSTSLPERFQNVPVWEKPFRAEALARRVAELLPVQRAKD
jgi:CheY-like chemotaxis protein